MQDNALVQEIARALYERKAQDIVALNVGHLTVITDYMVIASGRNANLVKALADEVDERMAKEGLALRRMEGQGEGRWIVMDYGHILVQLFHQEERAYYNLERLWEDGTNRLVLPFDQTAE
ncbi:MAG: ribosome silencing factor [Clostridia bacterium]|nr:ribosome silencing factor [Clostridia bacterium]